MPITLTTDALLSIDDAKAIIDEGNPALMTLLINSVSAQFLKFTNRTRITSAAAQVEYLRGPMTQYLFPHATPVTAIASILIYSNGVLEETLTGSDYCIAMNGEAIYRYNSYWSDASSEEFNVKVTYTGGFSTVPGDVIRGAVEQMRYERARLQGQVGVTNVSAHGETVAFENSDLLKSVASLWARYKVLA